MTTDLGRRWRRTVSPVLVAVAAVSPFVLATTGPPDHRPPTTLGAAQAWLTTRGTTDAVLVDGPSAAIVGRAAWTEENSTTPGLTQAAGDAYAVAPGGGAVRRLSGVTQRASESPAEGLPGSVELRASAARLYVYPVDGRLVRLRDDGTHTRGVVLPARASTVTTGRGPAVVNPVDAEVTWLDEDASVPRSVIRSESLSWPGDVLLAGDRADGDVYVVTPESPVTVTVCRFGGSCSRRATLPDGVGTSGTPVVAGGRLLLPDAGAGEVRVVGPDGSLRSVKVFSEPGPFELVAEQGYAFANRVDTEDAAVISPDDEVTPVTKTSTVPTAIASPKPPTTSAPSKPQPPASGTGTGESTVGGGAPQAGDGLGSGAPTGTGSGSGGGSGGSGSGGGGGTAGGGSHGSGVAWRPSTDDVDLRISTGATVHASVHVRVTPPAGYAYFLVVGLDGEFWAHRQVEGAGGYYRLAFPCSSRLDRARTARVVVANGADRRALARELVMDDDTRPSLDGLPGTTVSAVRPFVPDPTAGEPSCPAPEPSPTPGPSPTPRPSRSPAPEPTRTGKPRPTKTKEPVPTRTRRPEPPRPTRTTKPPDPKPTLTPDPRPTDPSPTAALRWVERGEL
jgi:uncharacterized membrane protein YgcG